MKKILFFAVMFCVALSTAMLVSCGGDDDEDQPKGDTMFKSEITLTDDLLSMYKDITIVYQFADGKEISGNVTSTFVTFQQDMPVRQDVVVKFEGTLREDAVNDDQTYDLRLHYKGVHGGVTRKVDDGYKYTGKQLKEKGQKLSGMPGYRSNTYNFTKSMFE